MPESSLRIINCETDLATIRLKPFAKIGGTKWLPIVSQRGEKGPYTALCS